MYYKVRISVWRQRHREMREDRFVINVRNLGQYSQLIMQDYVEIFSLMKFVLRNKCNDRIQISSTFFLEAQRKKTRGEERVGRHFMSHKLFPSPSTTITRRESKAWLTWRAWKSAGVADLAGWVED